MDENFEIEVNDISENRELPEDDNDVAENEELFDVSTDEDIDCCDISDDTIFEECEEDIDNDADVEEYSQIDEVDDTEATELDDGSELVLSLDEEIIEELIDEMDENISYNLNGYNYEKNELGQITYAGGDLHLGEGVRDNYAQRMAGGEDRHENDDGGHLIGARFDGYGGEGNLIAQDYSVNRGGYKSLEDQWVHELEQGNKVHVDIEPICHGDSIRPDVITGSYEVTSGDKSYKDYFSMTNENLRSEEFELPPEADEQIWGNAMNTDYKEYEKELE